MQDLYIDKTSSTPDIRFNAKTGILKIEGRSIPENPTTFYEPLLEWLSLYIQSPNESTVFDIKLEYINSGSSKLILSLLKVIKELHAQGTSCKINWYYEEDDESIRDLGLYFSSIIKPSMELIEIYT